MQKQKVMKMIGDVEVNQVISAVLLRRNRRQANITSLRAATTTTANVVIAETAAELIRNASDSNS